MIYLDNAATTYPKPASVRRAVGEGLKFYGGNPGRSSHKMSMESAKKVYECRETAAQFFGAKEPENILFACNCTHALNMAIRGVRSEHFLITGNEHNSVVRPVHAVTKGDYAVFTVFEGNSQRTVEDALSKITGRTKAAVLTFSSNVTGVMTPVQRIGTELRRRGIIVIVDAAQGAGYYDLKSLSECADLLCVPGHKGLYGPPGTGLLVRYSDVALDPLLTGGTGSSSLSAEAPDFYPDRMEAGTLNTPGIIGLQQGMRFVMERDLRKIREHDMSLVRLAYEMLAQLKGIELYTEYPTEGFYTPLLSFNVDGMPSEQVASSLSDLGIAVRGGLHCAPLAHRNIGTLEKGTVRISPSVFTRRQDIERLAVAVRKIQKNR